MDQVTLLIVIQIVTQIVVGIVLWGRIKSQDAILGHYKNLVEAIDPAKMKAQMATMEEATEMKHRALAAKQVEQIAEDALKFGIHADQQFTAQYNEMMGVHLFHIGKLKGPEREIALAWFPTSHEVMRKHLRAQDERGAKNQGSE